MQAPGGIGHDESGPPGSGVLNGVEDDRGRIRAVGTPDDAGAGTFGPRLELLSCRGPERVPGGQDHVASRLGLSQGELSDRRRLADPVHPDEEPHRRPVALAVGERLDIAFEHRDEIVLKRLEESRRVGRRKGATAQPVPEVTENSGRGRDTHVGKDEGLLELLESRVVDALATSDLVEVTRQQAPGSPEPVPQHRACGLGPRATAVGSGVGLDRDRCRRRRARGSWSRDAATGGNGRAAVARARDDNGPRGHEQHDGEGDEDDHKGHGVRRLPVGERGARGLPRHGQARRSP